MQQFYKNKILERFASIQPNKVSLKQLTVFGKSLTPSKILSSANHVKRELTVRLSHRIRSFQQIPFIVGSNPDIQMVYGLYWDAFERFRNFPEIETHQDNRNFCEMLTKTLQMHRLVIPHMITGLADAAQHISPAEVDALMVELISSRIGRRVLAEQHISLTMNAKSGVTIGIVNTKCVAHHVIRKVVSTLSEQYFDQHGKSAPKVVIDGDLEANFTYIDRHIEFIMYEILKSAFKAGKESQDVRVTIGRDHNHLTFRISSPAPPEVPCNKVWSWSASAKRNRDSKMYHIGQMGGSFVSAGLGMPMVKVFALYWGGDVEVYTMPGFGSDTYVVLSTCNELERL